MEKMSNRNRYFLIFFLGIFLVASCTKKKTTEPDIPPEEDIVKWWKTFGGSSSYEYGFSVQQTSDGGYIIAGTVYSFRGYETDIYLVKTDALGESLWTKTYGENDSNEGKSVQQTSDGGYIIAGFTEPGSQGWADVCLIKTDATGNLLWSETYGGPDFDKGNSVHQTSDGGYVIAGYSESFGSGDSDVYLIRTDANGCTLWTRIYGGEYDEKGHSVQETDDGGYIIAGNTSYSPAGWSDVYLIKTDTLGDTLWTKTYGETDWDAAYSVQQTSDGGYITTGVTESFSNDIGDVYLIKTDSLGDTLWTRTYGGDSEDIGYSVQETTDGGYIIAGSTKSFGEGWEENVYLIKTNKSGRKLWTISIGGTSPDGAYSIQQTSDQGYITAGWSESFGSGGADIYLIKIQP